MKLYIDLETYSENSIKLGIYKYVEKAEILLIAYAIDGGTVKVHDNTKTKIMPRELASAFANATELIAHNSEFDRTILEKFKYVPPFDPRWRDTAARALAHSLPGGLGALSDIFRLPVDKAKDKAGRDLIRVFCVPQKDGRRIMPEELPAKWAQFIDYARLDIEAMRELDRKLPRWSDERELWTLDQKVNARGVQIDTELCEQAVAMVERAKKQSDKALQKATGGEVGTVMQRDAVLDHIEQTYGIRIPDLRKSTLERRVNDENLPDQVREILAMRLDGASTSVSKYQAMLKSVCNDGRIKGMFKFCGANRTGRWSGHLVQLHNMPRPRMKWKTLKKALDALKAGYADLLYDPSILAPSAIRSALIAAPGKKLVISDLSAIEGRVLAWLAGETSKLKAYYEIDRGIGADIYCRTYASTFGVDPMSVTKQQRQLGKVLELALGYGGGVGAFVTFALGYGINLDELADTMLDRLPHIHMEAARDWYGKAKADGRTHKLKEKTFIVCDAIKRMWREANPNTVRFWYDLENAFRDVISGAPPVSVGDHLVVDKVKSWVRVRLPSGRYVCYPACKIKDGKICYKGTNVYVKSFGDIYTYSGKLAENMTQSVARDVLGCGMLYAEKCKYNIVLHVHDELVAEVPDNLVFNEQELSKIMSSVPPWAPGLPLAAAGFESYVYRKED